MGPWPYFVGFTTDEEAFQRELRRLKIRTPTQAVNDRANATTHFLVRDGGSSAAIIVMPKPTRQMSREQYAALVAHEAVHVLQDMREGLGKLGEEAEAYIVQGIVQESLQVAWRTGRRTSRTP